METLNNIELNPVLISALYPHSLVETAAAQPEKKLNEEVKYLGNNNSRVLILVHSSEHTFLAEEELTFLSKILGACKLNIGDVAIVNTAFYQHTQHIVETLSPVNIITFEPARYDGVIKSIQASPLSKLIEDSTEARALKTALWSNLKGMFGI